MGKFIDLTGKRFGKLLVLKRIGSNNTKNSTFLCKCDCGTEKIFISCNLRSKYSESCGCIKRESYKKLIGKKFNRLVIISFSHYESNKSGRIVYFNTLCDCGKEKKLRSSSIKNGTIKSCGCYQKEINSNRLKKDTGIACFNTVYRSYKSGAQRRNYQFNLTKEEFKKMTSLNCYYCGETPKNIKKNNHYNGDYIYNGIDRFDNKIGYTIENCVPCCETCNRSKMCLSKEEFFNMIKKISKLHNLK